MDNTTVSGCNTTGYIGGYCCVGCGTWVNYGSFHSCFRFYPQPQYVYWPGYQTDPAILEELRQIKELLKDRK